MLTPVRGTLVNELRARRGGDFVLRVDTDTLAPEILPQDYLGFAHPSVLTPRSGDCVVASGPDGALGLRIYEDLAGEAALMPLAMGSTDDILYGEDAVEGVAVWLHRITPTAHDEPLRISAALSAGLHA